MSDRSVSPREGPKSVARAVADASASAVIRLVSPLDVDANASVAAVTGLDKLPTAFKRKHSIGDRAASISILHLLTWILLFVLLSLCTAVLLNWFLRQRQQVADDSAANPVEEEMRLTSKDGVASGTTTAVPVADQAQNASDPPSTASLGMSSGASSRQRFLETRRAAAQRSYGTTERADGDEVTANEAKRDSAWM